jgi:hypothetical protein
MSSFFQTEITLNNLFFLPQIVEICFVKMVDAAVNVSINFFALSYLLYEVSYENYVL